MSQQQYVPFDAHDLELTGRLSHGEPLPEELARKIDLLRRALDQHSEFTVASFTRHSLRREVTSPDHLVFSPPQRHRGHWYLYSLGGELDQVHLNIGMWPTHVRVGLGFSVGQQVKTVLPAFRQFQHLLGMRPPLLFRDGFFRCVRRHGMGLEDAGMPYWGDPHDILSRLETYVAPDHREAGILLVVGALWKADHVVKRTVGDMRRVLRDLLPFYEALVLMAGRLQEEPE